MDRYRQIGRRIRTARESFGLSQEELGRRLGLSGVAVGHYERGARAVGIAELEGISAALDRPVTWFLTVARPWSEVVEEAYAHVQCDPTFPHGARHDTDLDAPFKEFIVRLYEKARQVKLLPTDEERLDAE